MVQSRSDEAKAYRQRKKQDPNWLAEEARKKRERRVRSRPTPAPVVAPTIAVQDEQKEAPQATTLLDSVFEAKQAFATASGNSIKKATVVSALNRIKRLHKYKTGHEMTCFDWVRDTAAVVKFVESCEKWKSLESKLQQFQALSSILKVFDGYQKEYKFYSSKSVFGRKQIEKIEDENKLTDKERQNYLEWGEITKLKSPEAQESALVGVYTLIPPRRATDFGLMKLSDSEADLDKNFNYLVKGKNFVFLNYKTEKKFGRQEFSVPKGLSERLHKYIASAGLASGDFLFGKSKTEAYKSFSPQITKVFKKHLNKSISVNILRHSYVSHFLKKERTLAERKQVASKMAHSVLTQLKYNRII